MKKKKWWKWFGLFVAIAVVLSLAIPTALADDTHTRTGFPKVDPSNPDAALTVTYHQSAARGILPLVNEFRSSDEAYYWNQDDTSIIRKDSLLYFQYDYDLEQIAMQRAVEYAARDAFGINRGESAHNRPTGEKYTTAVLDNGASSYGENLCSGNRLDSSYSALELWKESDEPYSGQGHRRLILNDSEGHNAIGVGCVEYKGIYYWAMEFGPVRANESTASLDKAYQVCIEVPALYESIGEPLDTRAIRETGACGYHNRGDIQWILYEDGELLIRGNGDVWAQTEDGEYSPWLGNRHINKVTIEEGVSSISYFAFRGCESITEVSLPKSLTSIGQGAFDGCKGIAEIELPASLETIYDSSFQGTNIKELSIPSGLKVIGDRAFANNPSLKTVHIPSSVTAIKGGAFAQCNNIEDVYYEGSPSEWEAIEGDSQSAALWAAPNIHYGKEDPTTTTKTTTTTKPSTEAKPTTTRTQTSTKTTASTTSTTKSSQESSSRTTTSSTTNASVTTKTNPPTATTRKSDTTTTITSQTTTTQRSSTTTSKTILASTKKNTTAGTTSKTIEESAPNIDSEKNEEIPLNGIVNGYDGKWALYENGKVNTAYTGIAKNQYGWWRIENGYVDFQADGIYRNEYGWWKVTDGKVTFDETGVFKNEYGWWRVVNSKVDFNANGIYKNKYGWWKTTNGKVTFNENGVFKNENGWWKVKNSKVDFNFTGIAKNQYGTWYVKNGKVDFSKNGTVKFEGKTYTVKNGKVQ